MLRLTGKFISLVERKRYTTKAGQDVQPGAILLLTGQKVTTVEGDYNKLGAIVIDKKPLTEIDLSVGVTVDNFNSKQVKFYLVD